MAGWYQQQQQQQQGIGEEEGVPMHLGCLMGIILVLLSLSWYMNYESAVESAVEQVKLVVALSPLVILLAARWLSAAEPGRVPFSMPMIEKDAPWGVAAALVLLLFMVSFRS